MPRRTVLTGLFTALAAAAAGADEVKLLARPADPYGAPRPGSGQKHVPLRTTFYVELGMAEKGSTDTVLDETVGIELEPEGGPAVALLRPGRRFADGYAGRFLPA